MWANPCAGLAKATVPADTFENCNLLRCLKLQLQVRQNGSVDDGSRDGARFLGLSAGCRTSEIKKVVLAAFRDGFERTLEILEETGSNKKTMAEAVNSRSNRMLLRLMSELPEGDDLFRARVAVTVSYCHAVVSIESRQRVWPYNLLDLSRRIGELWQATCLVAWAHSAVGDIEEMVAPAFADVRKRWLSDIWELFHDHPNVAEGLEMIDEFTERMDEISMASDKLFSKAGVPHVIDFKFRFRSNEKGNKNRVDELGWAYREWNGETDLSIIVCHTENNNYLEMLDKNSVWNVVTGRNAYRRIEDLTGFPLADLLDECVDFRSDLPPEFVAYIDAHQEDMKSLIDWQTDTSKVDRHASSAV